ncbi:MAG: ASCH domain-containing protein [Candidatus Aenigmarchaeota archaeon]|nr:ASCH domain-containing protein [Candidatus Aenigmarchaeota archaeon]
MKKRILHLTLLKKWFDLIACGKKIEEYREIKPYWTKRLIGNSFDEIYFKNGYNKNAPFMKVEWKGLKKGKDKYIISLGKIIEIKK